MIEIEHDAVLGKVIFTDNAITKMNKNGLYRRHIIYALKQGYEVKPLLHGTRQLQCRYANEKEIGVIFKDRDDRGILLGGVLIISAWAKTVK